MIAAFVASHRHPRTSFFFLCSLHHSNLFDDAPTAIMQRLAWVALHGQSSYRPNG